MPSSAGLPPITELHRLIDAHFTRDELDILCFELGVDVGNLRGDTKLYRAMELILLMQRQQRLPALLHKLAERRPTVAWPQPTPAAEDTAAAPEPAPASETAPASMMDQYQVDHTIYEGYYSRVLRCRRHDTGALCIVKATEAERVSLPALQAIQALDCPNVAAPRRIWEEGGRVYEELPYVGGVRLSQAITSGLGGLGGSVLESFIAQMERILQTFHQAGLVHRDIHPDNVYLLVRPARKGAAAGLGEAAAEPWQYQGFGRGDNAFLIAWVLVDCTFAARLDETPVSAYRHGTYTPEEQALGHAQAASDLYAYGATLYTCITGKEIPSYRTRRLRPDSVQTWPFFGGHSALNFAEYVEQLLDLVPAHRPRPNTAHFDYATIAPAFTGALRLADDQLLLTNTFDTHTEIAAPPAAREYLTQIKRTDWLEGLA